MTDKPDPDAVLILFRDTADEQEYVLGYVPRTMTKPLAMFLEMGYTDIFDCHISSIDPAAHYEQQLHVTIRIKLREKKKACE